MLVKLTPDFLVLNRQSKITITLWYYVAPDTLRVLRIMHIKLDMSSKYGKLEQIEIVKLIAKDNKVKSFQLQ
jgi:hypothetical protein